MICFLHKLIIIRNIATFINHHIATFINHLNFNVNKCVFLSFNAKSPSNYNIDTEHATVTI